MSTPLEKRFKVIVAVYVVFRETDKVLLLRRANTGYLDGSYSLPAGHIEGNESAISAAAREALEEVGTRLSKQELKLVHVMHRVSDLPSTHERIDFYFQTDKKHGEIKNCEPAKCDELRWCVLGALPKNMVPEVKLALDKIARGEFYSDYRFKD